MVVQRILLFHDLGHAQPLKFPRGLSNQLELAVRRLLG
jgi:hypothetical protein